MKPEEIVEIINAASERACVEHLGAQPNTWYTGGSSHNDDRIVATVTDDGRIHISGRSDVCEDYRANEFETAEEWSDFAREITETAWEEQ